MFIRLFQLQCYDGMLLVMLLAASDGAECGIATSTAAISSRAGGSCTFVTAGEELSLLLSPLHVLHKHGQPWNITLSFFNAPDTPKELR